VRLVSLADLAEYRRHRRRSHAAVDENAAILFRTLQSHIRPSGLLLLAISGLTVPAHAQGTPDDLDTLPPLPPIEEEAALPGDPTGETLEVGDQGTDWGVAWPDTAVTLPPLEELPPPEVVASDIADPFPLDESAIASSEGESAVTGDGAAAVEMATAESLRYIVVLDGFGDVADARFRQRFDGLSVLRAGDDEPANGAQLNRRIATDTGLLDRLLRNEGYYDATLVSETRRADAASRLTVAFTVQPGPRYSFSAVKLTGLDAAGAEEAARLAPLFAPVPGEPLAAGEPILADDIVASQAALESELRETGYPFGDVGTELLTIDHDVRQGQLDQPVAPGARLRFGEVIAEDNGLLGADHIQRIARFRPGEWYKWSDTEDLRRALIATGLVASVDIVPTPSPDGQTVDMTVALEPAPPRTIAGLIGFSSGEGLRAEASWEHRNLFRPEGALILRAIAGTREQLASVTVRRNNFLRRDHVLTGQALVSNIQSDAFDARTIYFSGRLERSSTLIFQKIWSWALGAEILGTDELAFVAARNADERQRYVIGGLFGLLSYDRSNSLLDPTQGFRLTARIAPELSFNSATGGYLRAQFDATGYLPVSERIVLASRARIGAIVGSDRDDIAPSRRYYSGGGGSVRGYGFQRIGPLSPDGNPIGGTSLFEIAAEARIKAFGDFTVVPFIDAGNVYATALPRLDEIGDLRFGAGVGVRYATNFGPIRVDVGTPLNPREGDNRITVYVSLGQAF
jgi:translocation and assembly module TamA